MIKFDSNEKYTLVVDIDGTLCGPPIKGDYKKCVPDIDMIHKVNSMYNKGHMIILFTSRGMRSYDGDIDDIRKYVKPVLVEWLETYGVQYHELKFGKPWGNNVVYIDDRAIRPNEFKDMVILG